MLYYFDSMDDGRFEADDIGAELLTLEAAKRLAVNALVDLARDKTQGLVRRQLTIEVRDSIGNTVFQVSLTFDVSEPGQPMSSDGARSSQR